MTARALETWRKAPRVVRVLLLSDLVFNFGFYMLMPYVAGHSYGLGLSAWMVGLVLGVRTFSHQALSVAGGVLAERWGYRAAVVRGCALRVAGFLAFSVADGAVGVTLAAFLTGAASALFGPSARAYLAAEAGSTRTEVFALSCAMAQAGAVAGPLLGIVLDRVGFEATALAAAGVFAVWGLALRHLLPAGDRVESAAALPDVRDVAGNRPFIAFAVVMGVYMVLFNQLYLLLPLALQQAAGTNATAGLLFTVSGALVVVGQVPIAAYGGPRWPPMRAVSAGLALMGAAFVPLLAGEPGVTSVFVSTALLTLGMMVAHPFAMDLVAERSGGRDLAVYYGAYSLVTGVVAAIGNVGVGAMSGAVIPNTAWLALIVLGVSAGGAALLLERKARPSAAAEVRAA